MKYEKRNLGNSGYGNSEVELKVMVQDNLEEDTERKRPAVIICPGGGYEFCSDREGEPVALEFLRAGWQAFVLQYTVLNEEEEKMLLPYPQIDLARAVACVRDHAQEWHIDPERIVILGCSAGANLCALYSGFSGQGWFTEKTGLSKDEMEVHAMILCYPVIDMTQGWPREERHFRRICGDGTWSRAQELVTEQTPPTFLWHTNTDATVPAVHSLLYAEKLYEHGVDYECHMYHRGKHGLSLAKQQTARCSDEIDTHVSGWLQTAMEWLEEIQR